jgi:hypothetical protein
MERPHTRDGARAGKSSAACLCAAADVGGAGVLRNADRRLGLALGAVGGCVQGSGDVGGQPERGDGGWVRRGAGKKGEVQEERRQEGRSQKGGTAREEW